MAEEKILTQKEYCVLFENLILAEYDNLFSNGELRTDLGLDETTMPRFGLEYLSAAVYLFADLLKLSPHEEAVRRALEDTIRSDVFRRILPADVAEGMEAPYILYSLKRGMALDALFSHDDEGMRALIDACLTQAGQDDPVCRMAQSVYLMNLLPALVCLMGDLLRSAQAEETDDGLTFRIAAPEEA